MEKITQVYNCESEEEELDVFPEWQAIEVPPLANDDGVEYKDIIRSTTHSMSIKAIYPYLSIYPLILFLSFIDLDIFSLHLYRTYFGRDIDDITEDDEEVEDEGGEPQEPEDDDDVQLYLQEAEEEDDDDDDDDDEDDDEEDEDDDGDEDEMR